jgi:HK97 family phage portal protein
VNIPGVPISPYSWENLSATASSNAKTALADARKRIKADLSLTDPKAWDRSLWNLVSSRSVSGENVSEASALTYSAYFAGVALYAGTISTLPLHLRRKDGNKSVLAVEKPLFRTLYAQPNPFMTAQALRSALMGHVLTWGNAYAEKVRDGYGMIRELWPITPDRVKPKWADSGIVYDITVNGRTVSLLPDKVLHLHGLGFDGLVGYSIVAMARKSIGLGMAMETFGAAYFGNGTHPGMIIEHPNKLTEQGSKNLRETLTETYSGLGQSHRMMLLEEGMKANPFQVSPEDSQFLESREFQIPEIARWLNLPPHKLKDLTRSSFNNIESEQISFVTDSVLPWLITFEQQYNVQLLTLDEQNNQKLFFKHNVEGLLRGDAASRGNLYRALFNVGALSPNDIREKEDFDPIPDPMADEYFVPLNMVPLSMVKETLAKKPAGTPPGDGQNPRQSGGEDP